jgi:hypothetical protein
MDDSPQNAKKHSANGERAETRGRRVVPCKLEEERNLSLGDEPFNTMFS